MARGDGDTFGCLTLIKFEHNRWTCRCECGRVVLRSRSSLKGSTNRPTCRHLLGPAKICEVCCNLSHRRRFPKCPGCGLKFAPEEIPRAFSSGLGTQDFSWCDSPD